MTCVVKSGLGAKHRATRSKEMVLGCWSWPRCFKPLKLVFVFNVELIWGQNEAKELVGKAID